MIAKMEGVRRDLLKLIDDWNASRLDLFHLSKPNEYLEFVGVMRFFFQDNEMKFQTKCLRVSSTMKTSEIIPLLLEKFYLISVHLDPQKCGLYEHFTNSERKLDADEYPLLVQLNWTKLGQEGKFILKVTSDNQASSKSDSPQSNHKSNELIKKNGTKSVKKASKSILGLENLLCSRGLVYDKNEGPSSGCGPRLRKHDDDEDALDFPDPDLNFDSRCDSPPNSTFTRMISDPEALMQKTRQEVLGSKLSQFAGNGYDDMGGTLKIYGELIDPSVPYKTLLLSTRDTVTQVIRQALDKYGLQFADPSAYCLVMRTRYANEIPGMEAHEEILQDDFCPLKLLLSPDLSPEGIVTTFELRPRLTRIEKQRNGKSNGETVTSSELIRLPYHQNNRRRPTPQLKPPTTTNGNHNSIACLVEVVPEGKNNRKPTIYSLPLHLGKVCVGTSQNPSSKFPLLVTLPGNSYQDVIPFHIVIWQPSSKEISSSRGWLVCAPVAQESLAPVLVNGRRLVPLTVNSHDSERKHRISTSNAHWLAPGDIIQLGSSGRCRFCIWPGPNPPPPPKPPSLVSSVASPTGFRPNGSDKLSVATPNCSPHQSQYSLRKAQTPQQPHRQLHHPHHQSQTRIYQHYHEHNYSNGHRPNSMESARSDFSDSTNTATTTESCSVPSTLEADSVDSRQRSHFVPPSPSLREHVIVASTKYTDSRTLVARNRSRDDSSSSTSQTLSTSGIGTSAKYTDSRSGTTLSVRKNSSSSSSAPPLLDRLPCQLAYAPSSLDALLDWLLLDPFRCRRSDENVERDQEAPVCPLGSAFSVYLMLRAICRQCDRWEALENRKMTPATAAELKSKQRIRRQRELLSLFTAVTDRLVSVECHLGEGKDDLTSRAELEDKARRGAAVLSNISQLLYFISKDVDLQRIFQSAEYSGEGGEGCGSAWMDLVDRLAELVESVFNSLLSTLTSLISSKKCLPALVASWDLRASTCRENETEGVEEEEIEITDDTSISDLSDPVLEELTRILGILHANLVNPAFLVQLFARILHYISARLFNGLVEEPVRVSPQWGRLLSEWIHKKLVGWAEPQGLRVAVECYLTRLSQAATLMQANMKTVEGLYNTAVDLDRLNSVQVRFILRAYRPSYARALRYLKDVSEITTGSSSEYISVQWIDFIISGVTQVSDRLLSEESEQSDWKPQLLELLDLRLPLLLPDDCYPSATRIRNPHLEPNTESSQQPQTDSDRSSLKSQSGAVEINDLSNYLRPALLSGWCRLSFRQNPNQRSEPWLSWDIYLANENASSPNEKVRNLSVDVDPPSRDSPGPKTPPACEPPLPPVTKPGEIINTDSPSHESTSELGSANLSDSVKVDDNRSIRIFSVAVPKIGNNLGLSIIAARSEDGSDLGIYVKSVAQGGGASQARWLSHESSTEQPPQPVIAPGDRILAVDGKETRGLSQDAAARLVSLAGSEVRLTLARNLGLGCVAAAVPAKDLRKRNGQSLVRSNTTVGTSSAFIRDNGVNLHSMRTKSTGTPQLPTKVSTTVVRAASVTTSSNRQSVEQVELKSDGESLSPPSPRVLVETRYLLAHEVPSTTTTSGVQRSRSLMSHGDMNPSKRFSVERGSWDSSDNAGYSHTLSFSFTTDSNTPTITRPVNQFQSDQKGSDRILMTTKSPASNNNNNNNQCSSWEEMDVDSTLEMLKEMRDQLDRSLALRNQRVTPIHSTVSSTSTASDWKPTHSVTRNRDTEDTGNLESPGRTVYPPLGRDKAVWNEESSAFRTTPDRKGIVRSASTYSPMNYKSSASVDDDSQRNQYVFRTPTESFSSRSGVTRSNTSERLHSGTKAIYASRGPFRHNVSTDHLLTRVHPATIARGATSRSYDFEIEHRRSQSAEQNLNDNIDVGRQPSVAERVKLFQNAIENHCK